MIKGIRLLAVGVGLCSMAWTPLLSGPFITTVTGQFQHGQPVTLSGGSFGNHADHNGPQSGAYFRWKNFEDCEIESDGFTVQFWPNWQVEGRWSVEVAGARPQPGSVCYGSKRFATSGQDPRLGTLSAEQENTTGEWFISFWFMMPPDTQSGKYFRIYGSGDARNIWLSSGGVDRMTRGFSACIPGVCDPAPQTQWTSPLSFGDGSWHRVDMVMDEYPDEFNVYIDQQFQWHRSACGNNQYVRHPFGGDGHTIDVGSLIDDPAASNGMNGSYNFDDIYVTFTRARVEVCSGATWESRGTCEIQPVDWWLNGSISVRVNQGAFASLSSAYLYVVDAAGKVNASGKPVTFAAGAP